MAHVTLAKISNNYFKESFPYVNNPTNRSAARVIIRLFIYYSFMAAMNGFRITTKRINSYTRFELKLVMEKTRPLKYVEKKMYLTSYRKFGYMFRFDLFGVFLGKGEYHFIPEQGMLADLQDTINSNTIYALTHEKSFN